jgi:hypothetical protein
VHAWQLCRTNLLHHQLEKGVPWPYLNMAHSYTVTTPQCVTTAHAFALRHHAVACFH